MSKSAQHAYGMEDLMEAMAPALRSAMRQMNHQDLQCTAKNILVEYKQYAMSDRRRRSDKRAKQQENAHETKTRKKANHAEHFQWNMWLRILQRHDQQDVAA